MSYRLKILLPFFLIICVGSTHAQQIDSVFVNLYTDSLKKGTFNYINVDGLLHNGRYMPLDSNHIVFKCSHGKFYGNNLWIDSNINVAKVDIQLYLKKDNSPIKKIEMYIKTKEDEALKTEQEILNELNPKRKKKQSN